MYSSIGNVGTTKSDFDRSIPNGAALQLYSQINLEVMHAVALPCRSEGGAGVIAY